MKTQKSNSNREKTVSLVVAKKGLAKKALEGA